MKKMEILFLTILALLLGSCETKYENFEIAGDWVSVKSGYVDDGYHEETTDPCYLSIAIDNKYTMKYQDLAEEGTYILKDNTLTFNKMKGKDVLVQKEYTIKKLNSHELTLRFTFPGTQGLKYSEIFFMK